MNNYFTNFSKLSQCDYANSDDEDSTGRNNNNNNHEPNTEIPKSPEGLFPPHPLIYWVPNYKNRPNIQQFDDVDKPGGCCEYTFHAMCLKNGAFKGYSMPAGAEPVPARDKGR